MGRVREKLVLANGPTPKITPQSDEKPLVYLSHTVVHGKELEEELIRCSGVRYRCFSFVYLIKEAIYFSERARIAYDYNVKRGSHIMMDSGAFSFHHFVMKRQNVKNIEALREKTIEQYVQFCKQHQKNWDFAVTFDYIQDQKVIREVTKRLEGEGCKITPVYHGESSLDNLKRWLDEGYSRIGVSTLPWRKQNHKAQQKYYDGVFRTCEPYKVKLHGFAVTSLNYMFAWPWHSVDSSSWSRTASYGAIYALDPQRGSLVSVHLSLTGGLKSDTNTATMLSPQALKSVRNQVEGNGWDFDLLRRSLAYRFIHNAYIFSHIHQYRKHVERNHTQWEPLL